MSTSNSQTIKKLARRVKADPGDSFSKFALALEFLKRDELKRAKILFEDIHQNDPEYLGVYYHLGKLNERLDEPEIARKLYRAGMSIAKEQQKKRTHRELEEALAAVNIELETQEYD